MESQKPVSPAEADLADNNLLSGSDSIQDVQIKAGETTEVVSIASEEERTGQKINVPNAEELVARANISYIQNLKMIEQLINAREGSGYKISRKGMNRLLLSVLSLPMDDQRVALQGDYEKTGFGVGQRLIADRFLLTQHHISEEIKRRNAEKEQAQQPPPVEGEQAVQQVLEGGTNEQQ